MSGRLDKQQPATIDADLAAEFAALGATVAVTETPETAAMYIWQENWPSFMAFLSCETQWRIAVGLGGAIRLGLDYAAVDTVLRRLKCADAVFGDLQVMEREALSVFAEA